MSTRYSLAQRTPMLNSLFAGLACAVTLTLTAGPAFAASELERVNVQGRMVEAPVRYDVTAACTGIEQQLQGALADTWQQSQREGLIAVQFVMQGDAIESVSATGLSNGVERSVRKAVRALHCGAQATTTAQVYRFQIHFAEPDAGTTTAAAQSAVRMALAKR
ncbi:MAG: hypothetical protein EKK53_22690 [Burkholderiales bacterium]|nr:MAG: hypothetical protein EKK53_22690 [Burkholderiales bacterium]